MLPYFARRLHELAIGPDVVIAITTAKRCHSLIPHDDPNTFKLHWLYSDGTITKTPDNSVLSTITGQSHPRMNINGHQVYSKVMSVEPMTLHLHDDTPLDILDDPATDYLRIDMGRLIASRATGNFDDFSITHHTETGLMLLTPVTQYLGVKNWPELRFSPRSGCGRSIRCTEPLILSLLNKHDHCFPCRPNSSLVVDGQRWGNVVIFSLQKGFNCMFSSRINTIIRNVATGEEFPLTREITSSNINMGLANAEAAASIKAHDDSQSELAQGTSKCLWQHTGCPGRYNQGCFRMSAHQGEIITNGMHLQCQLHDSRLNATPLLRNKYVLLKKLKHWHRVTTKDNAHLIAIAGKQWKKNPMNTDRACWVNGEPPQLESA